MATTTAEQRFTQFCDRWFSQLEQHRLHLLKAPQEFPTNEPLLVALVSQLTAHYKEFYTVKWANARDDVLAFFSPVWLTPLENAYSWVTGWKPSVLFRIVATLRKDQASTLAAMTEEQGKKIEELRLKIRMEEDKVERERERQQVGLADRKMAELARVRTSQGADVAVKALLMTLERIMKMADCVRLKTLKCLLEILTPLQSVEFLAAEATVQIRLRRMGREREIQGQKKMMMQTFIASDGYVR